MADKTKEGFAVNAVREQYLIAPYVEGTKPESVTGWLELAQGIETADNDDDTTVDDTVYYDGDGSASNEKTGGNYGYQFSGSYYKGNPAQELLKSMRFKNGSDCYVFLKHVETDGSGEVGLATAYDIHVGTGDAGDKGEFEATIHYNGMPTEISAGSSTVAHAKANTATVKE